MSLLKATPMSLFSLKFNPWNTYRSRSSQALAAICCLTLVGTANAQVVLTAANTAVTENFDTLAAAGTSSTLPTGWALAETSTGMNATYTAGTGSANAGDTYSFGAAAAAERALGGVQSGSLAPRFGAAFTNSTGGALTGFIINMTGEQWRVAGARVDRLDFQYSTDAADLATGTWVDFDGLDFVNPIQTAMAGALDGNAAANRVMLGGNVSVNIAAGATFRIRFVDFNATGADDGLAIDDFSITPQGAGMAKTVSVNDASVIEGNGGTVNMTFTLNLSAAAVAGDQVQFSTSDNTATTAGGDYVAVSNQVVSFVAGATSATTTVTINGDTTAEPNESFNVTLSAPGGSLTLGDASGVGTINNDDFTLTPIAQIQGAGNASPLANGTVVTTTGVVTAIKVNGFLMQSQTADADPLSSEGMLVFTGTGLVPAGLARGDLVRVTGNVLEFIPMTDLAQPPTTELVGNVTQALVTTILSSGNPLPAATAITTISASGNIQQLEPLEHMRVSLSGLQVAGATSGFKSEVNATSTSDGVFWATLPGVTRPIREAGIDVRETLIAGMPAGVPRFDANPETIRVDSDGQVGTTAINIGARQSIGAIVGVLDYGRRFYTLLPDPGQSLTVTPPALIAADQAAPAAANEFTVASYNLERFFNATDDAGSDPILTATAYANRLQKASAHIRNNLGSPDILGLIEVENLDTLTALAAKITTDGGPAYVPFLQESNDPGGIDVAFLVKPATRVTVNSVTQIGNAATYINPVTSAPDTLNDRAPLVLDATILNVGGAPQNVVVIVNHLRSFLGSQEDTPDGNRVRVKRRAQAEFLANYVQGRQTANPSERIVVLGDFNVYEFNDGYVDSLGTILGAPTPATQVLLASSDLVTPNLVRAVDASANYSYVFDGFTQNIDHVLLSQGLVNSTQSRTLQHVRLNADYPEFSRSDYASANAVRLSDHDALLLRVVAGPVATSCVLSASATPVVGTPITYSVTMTPSSATGSVSISNTAAVTCNAPLTAGSGSCAITHTAAGATTMTGSYPASAGFQASTCTLAQTVATAGTANTLASSLNPSVFGQSVALTATIVGVNPTGTVNFLNGATSIGSANLAGTGNSRTASISTTGLPVGSLPIVAQYAGDASNAASSSAVLTQVVAPAGTTVSLSASPFQITIGQSITLIATVRPQPPATGPVTGTVNFFSNGVLVGAAPLVNGVATLVLSNLGFGSYDFRADFSSSTGFASASSNLARGTVAPLTIPSLNLYGLLLLVLSVLGLAALPLASRRS